MLHRSFKGVLSKDVLGKKGLYPIIPLLLVNAEIHTLELMNDAEYEVYRFLLSRGHRLSHINIEERINKAEYDDVQVKGCFE